VATTARPTTGSGKGVFKRVLLGRAFASNRLEPTLLPKILALPVFASDALSSVAYATGEILIALALVTSQPQPYMMPIALAIASLMAIVVVSYRQTVRAYPNGGGAYIVSKDNLGVFPGLVAAAALLFDYMMTVIVSIVAGVFAIGSAFPWANENRVMLSIFFVIFVTVTNLRGSKESGTLFAVPTYGFVISILVLISIGLVRCLGGCPPVGVESELLPDAAKVAGTVGIFAILKAFSQGATALTGVEAISNGVPAFRRPQARNAATTLAIMGTIAVTMFLGISWLATHIDGVVASDERSVVAQITIAIFGNATVGFFVVQFFTAAILILAANTAYQDFPRLASILARDRFMPRQFVNRGDRLVFSNGVIVLGVLSSLMIYIYDANLNTLIHFYVVGVFTSFTLSQSGMVKHWIAEGRKADAFPGWRRSVVINTIGAVTTFVVLLVVIVSKFRDGAWLSILIMGLLVPVFYSIHRHYGAIMAQLRLGTVTPDDFGTNHVVLLVRDLGASTAEALGYLRSFRPQEVHAVYPVEGAVVPPEIRDRWRAFAGGDRDLEPLPTPGGDVLAALRTFLRALPRQPNDFVTVIVPEEINESLFGYLVRRRSLVRLKAGLLREPNVVVTDVPVVFEDSAPVGVDARALIPQRTVTLVFVSSVNDATIRAVNYARSIGAAETRAIYFDLDPDEAHRLEEQWFERRLGIPLDIVEAPFRDLTGPMLDEVRRFTVRKDTVVNVVIPEFLVNKWRHYLLHNQNALFIKRLFLYEERAVLTSVPFIVEDPRDSRRASRSEVADGS
jgi:amino acid transporter